MPDNKRGQTVRRIGSQWVKWRAAARVAEIIRELNDFGHTAEMLTKHDVLPETNLCVAVKAALRRKSVLVRYALKVMVLQVSDSLLRNSNAVGADLLIVADHHHFSGDVKEKKTFNTQLARFVDYYQVVSVWSRVNHFCHEVSRHDPDWDSFAPSPECGHLFGLGMQAVEEMAPGTQSGAFSEQLAEITLRCLTTMPKLILIREIRALSQPIIHECPTPRPVPIVEAVFPRSIAGGSCNRIHEAGDRGREHSLDTMPKFLVGFGLLNFTKFVVCSTITCNITLCDCLH